MENHDDTNDNTPEPTYRHPKVQNFRTLKSDILEVAKKQNKSLAQIVIASKEKEWQEKAGVGVEKRVYIENKYERPIYKIVLFVLVVGIVGLFLLRTYIFPTFENNTSYTTPEPVQNTSETIEASSTESTTDVSSTTEESVG